MSKALDSPASERRAALLAAKLRGLVSDHLGTPVEVAPGDFGAGAATIVDGAAWTLIDGSAARRLGAALAWAIRHGATSLHLIVDTDTDAATPARRASGFDFPITVWEADGRTLRRVLSEGDVHGGARVPTASEAHLALILLIEQSGATPHVERGVVTGEVRGLEVCRVVDEPTTGHFTEFTDVLIERAAAHAVGGVILEVGVGANDREAFQLLHGHVPTLEALKRVVDAVAAHRSISARQHPLNRMAPERFLRWQVQQEPGRLGLRQLTPADPPVTRQSMKHAEPCVGLGVDLDGRPVAVVFSAGVDLDLVPFVADVVLELGDDVDRLIVALPDKDLVPITRDLAALLVRDVELVAMPAE